MALAAAVPDGALLVPLLDAKKGEVYAGFYRRGADGGVEPALPDAVLAPADVAAQVAALAPGALVFGQGRAAHPAAFEALPLPEHAPRTPPAAALARLCAPGLATAAYDAAQVFALEPHYVRKSEAEVKFPHGLPPRAG
jgi:tRNA threonylcarbamoyladenosine biosynthesis protein TsaB